MKLGLRSLSSLEWNKWSIDRLIGWSIDGLIGWSIDRFIDWSIDTLECLIVTGLA